MTKRRGAGAIRRRILEAGTVEAVDRILYDLQAFAFIHRDAIFWRKVVGWATERKVSLDPRRQGDSETKLAEAAAAVAEGTR